MAQTLFWLVIIIVIAEFGLNTVMTVLNVRASHRPIPDILSDVYDREQYARQQEYSMQGRRFSLISSAFSTLVTLAIFASGGFAAFDNVARSVSCSPVVQALVFWGIFYMISWIISIPFDIYSTFVIEERFGFNRTTRKTFVADTFKSLAVNVSATKVLRY